MQGPNGGKELGGRFQRRESYQAIGRLSLDVTKIMLSYFPYWHTVEKMCTGDKLVVSTCENTVVANHALNSDMLSPSNHEEADTRIFLHVAHATTCRTRKLMIKTVDTDVVVLAIHLFQQLGLSELWIVFGVGRNAKFIPCHQIAGDMSSAICNGLTFFHAVSGCDMLGILWQRQWQAAWKALPDITDTFALFSNEPTKITSQDLSNIEKFVVAMYSRTCNSANVNDARRILFVQGNRSIENIPPTQDALHQHIKRSVYPAGYVWSQALKRPVACEKFIITFTFK